VRALTVRQPWAAAIAHGPKRIENRPRRIPANQLGATLCLHAGAADDRTPRPSSQVPRALTDGMTEWPRYRKAIIAVFNVVGCHKDIGCCRPWGFPDSWHWEIGDVRLLPEPVLGVRGQLGLWTVSDDILAAVQRQISREAAP